MCAAFGWKPGYWAIQSAVFDVQAKYVQSVILARGQDRWGEHWTPLFVQEAAERRADGWISGWMDEINTEWQKDGNRFLFPLHFLEGISLGWWKCTEVDSVLIYAAHNNTADVSSCVLSSFADDERCSARRPSACAKKMWSSPMRFASHEDLIKCAAVGPISW